MWLQPSAIVLMMVLQTCVAGRFERLERRLELKLKSFQASVEVRLDATEGYFDTLADRVSKLESIVDKSDTDIVLTRSNGSRNEPSIEYTKPELNKIQNTLAMYKTSFIKQKKEMNDVKFDIFTYLGNLSSDFKTKLALHVVGQIEDNNKTLIALNSQVRDHIANETESLEVFKTSILQDVNETRARVQNETTELEKKVEKLIGKANEVVGIIDEQRSTIEDGIMVTIRALHSSWSGWSAWSDCPQSCQSGSRSRHRSCDVHPPVTDGICIGNDTDTEECIIHEFCTLKSCPALNTPDNGQRMDFNYEVGTFAKFACNTGYEMVGVAQLLCRTDMEWSPKDPPTCEPVRCPDESYLANGRVVQETYRQEKNTFGITNRYYCNSGYVLKGSSARTCQANKSWSGTGPICDLPRCPDMRVENGRVENGEIKYIGDRARYTYAHVNCNDGYTVGKGGVETVECLGSLQWTSNLDCYKTLKPWKPDNSEYKDLGNEEEDLDHHETYKIRCFPNYELKQSNGRYLGGDNYYTRKVEVENLNGALKYDGEKDANTLSCVEKRCFQLDQSNYPNVVIQPKTKYVEHGESYHLSCENGFEHSLKSDPDFMCSSGRLGGTTPHCKEKPCDTPTIENGVLRNWIRWVYPKSTIASGDSVSLECSEGFFLYENRRNEFMEEHVFRIKCYRGNITSIPSCKKAKCECRYGGTCIRDKHCECPPNSTGEQCETPLCPGGCQNGGTCTSPSRCSCPEGFSGYMCQTEEGCQAPIDKGNNAIYRNGATFNVTHDSCSDGNVPSFKGQITCENGRWSEQIRCLRGARYRITVKTADFKWYTGEGTDGEVYLYMYGSKGSSGKIILDGKFEAGYKDIIVGDFVDVGELPVVRLLA
ncbi:sushi, von Willebrand factor type A, EGF and pentraxin domain-containing protein 1-like isoform X2 [Mya arenaria]|uniref:sushi, von Willebrand factor type A, EGF and pentraxin domain-containing protein 1-like isoform X2 n=1 Tax=Mya arenaria TaxID=6604 RepID=UPI0022DF3DF7|nr:sushi, von Willebrand factor type A, EGF and pentraxin domain-containing protein 1-like isoform X2 [Mya arenaria]